MTDPPPDDLDAYLDLTADEVARLILCLLVEEALRCRLAAYRRHEQPAHLAECFGALPAAVPQSAEISCPGSAP
jgi:hypothetical protein